MKKFLRRTWSRYSKLGRKRKKKQKWRKPTGRDNKMREKTICFLYNFLVSPSRHLYQFYEYDINLKIIVGMIK